ncbi:MAG: molybdate ABC transporter substrate-binding protein [Clostridium sp.]
MRKKIAILWMICLSILFMSCTNTKEEVKEINISVAASLVDPINSIIEEYQKENNIKINVNSGGSGTLKKQISEGAEIGIFFSASEKYVDDLIKEGLVSSDKKINPIGNTLVLIKNKSVNDEFSEISDLVNLNKKIAIGEVSTVPAGEYAKEALTNMNLWDSIESNTIYCKDVKAVKTYVERGEVDYGFIYKSDSIDLKDSKIIAEVPEEYHKKIVYSLAPINGYEYSNECNKFIEFINSDKGKEILEEYGFIVKS